jgi:hypothetical protein
MNAVPYLLAALCGLAVCALAYEVLDHVRGLFRMAAQSKPLKFPKIDPSLLPTKETT